MNPKLKTILQRYPLDKDAQGLFRLYLFDSAGVPIRMVERKNLILFSGADVMARVLGGQADYKVAAMYMEFKNLADPNDPITPPAYDRTGGIAYYNGLASSPDTDFLRIPLELNPALGSSGVDYESNQVTFFGISEGTTGFHGKPFNAAVNSAVYGGALIATPDQDDQAQDVVFSRAYAGIDKILKSNGFQIGITWTIQFN